MLKLAACLAIGKMNWMPMIRLSALLHWGRKTYSHMTRKGKNAIKCKGFTLNSANTMVVTHQKLIDLLPNRNLNAEVQKIVNVSNREFKLDRKSGEYWTELRNKALRFTADKNELDLKTYSTKPFGHEKFQ